MNIEYLKTGSEDCPLVRIYGNIPRSAKILHHHTQMLCDGEVTIVKVHELPGFNSINGCKLTFSASDKDIGLKEIKHMDFICYLLLESWCRVSGQIKELTGVKVEGYQWLDESSDISLLISRYETGAW
jgi:hypothetical protein